MGARHSGEQGERGPNPGRDRKSSGTSSARRSAPARPAEPYPKALWVEFLCPGDYDRASQELRLREGLWDRSREPLT